MEDASTQYTVIARRFRPQTFDDVVGQQHVARALRNAIAQGRVAHAYLFTGARGVGKTSMARILAKALNCPNVVDGVPCNQCDLCRSVAAGQDVDVSEIDGASNRGIDDIRQLRANVNVKSMRTKYKMYIIDEVHMLTKDAFNALLKTLEEPPPGVKFVFCTTEPNKVPDTILSRCQRFDFSTIETTNIIRRLQEIAEAEGFDVEPAAVELVARRAAGSMRDSQSIFDQLLAFGGERISAGDVHRLLGTAGDDRLVSIVQALVDRRRSDALQELDEALQGGVQLGELFDQLISYVRDLMVLASGAEGLTLLAVAPDRRDILLEQAKAWGIRTIVAALEILAEAKGRMFRATYSRALAEMALIRLTLLQDLDRIDDVIRSLRDGAAAVPRATATSRPAPAAQPSTNPSSPAAALRTLSESLPAQKKSPLSIESPSEATQNGHHAVADAVSVESLPAVDDLVDEDPSPPASASTATDLSPKINGTHPASELAPPQAIPGVEGGSALEFRPGNESKIWAQVISQISDMLKTHVRGVSRVAISGPNELDLIFPRSYHFAKQYCEQPAQVHRLEGLLQSATGRAVRIRFGVSEEHAPPPEPKGTPGVTSRRKVPETINDTFVQSVMGVFGATVVRVEAAPSPGIGEGAAEVASREDASAESVSGSSGDDE